MLKYLLPLLIAYTGGKNIGGFSGGIIGAIAVMGVIAGSDVPMFIGAMVIGPLAGWVIKKFGQLVEGKVPPGFEMLSRNFSVGILGMCCAIVGYYAIGPLVAFLTQLMSSGVEVIMLHGLLPLVSVIIEPAKVLFLNNAINHGILTPIGTEQVQQSGRSILFLLEANPGSGLGVLAAYWLFSEGNMKNSAPGAIIIHFFGGIHEIYFPYILARPVLIIAPMLGSASSILVYSILRGGLVAPASPGSIISLAAMSPKGGLAVTIIGIITAAVVSFLISIIIIKKAKGKGQGNAPPILNDGCTPAKKQKICKVVFACDAGMGSSAMGATRLRRRLEESGIHISVLNSSVDHIPDSTDVIVCQSVLGCRAQKSSPSSELLVINNFLNDPELDKLFARIKEQQKTVIQSTVPLEKNDKANDSVLSPGNIAIGLKSTSKEKAIRRAGELLQKRGYVQPGYVEAMLKREELTSTYLGMGIAIPHGTSGAKEEIIKTGLVVLQYPEGVSFGGEKAKLIIGIAASGSQHIDILAQLSSSLDDEETLNKLFTTRDKGFILENLGLKTKK